MTPSTGRSKREADPIIAGLGKASWVLLAVALLSVFAGLMVLTVSPRAALFIFASAITECCFAFMLGITGMMRFLYVYRPVDRHPEPLVYEGEGDGA